MPQVYTIFNNKQTTLVGGVLQSHCCVQAVLYVTVLCVPGKVNNCVCLQYMLSFETV